MAFPPGDFQQHICFCPNADFPPHSFSLALRNDPMQNKKQLKIFKKKREPKLPLLFIYSSFVSTTAVSSNPYKAFSSAAVTSFLNRLNDCVAPATASISSGKYLASIKD